MVPQFCTQIFRFQCLEAFLPELMLGGDAMKACMTIFQPHIKKEQLGEATLGKVVIGTPVKQFLEKAEEVKAQVIALSSLMTTSSYYQLEVIKNLKDAGLREKYYVVVGGGPITPQWTVQIGADGYARAAPEATQLFKRLVAEGVPPPLSQPITIGE